MTNIMTIAMEKLTDILIQADGKLKKMGAEPYGQRKLTEKEQRERVKNMTPQELFAMIDQYGAKDVNSWLQKYWQEDENA